MKGDDSEGEVTFAGDEKRKNMKCCITGLRPARAGSLFKGSRTSERTFCVGAVLPARRQREAQSHLPPVCSRRLVPRVVTARRSPSSSFAPTDLWLSGLCSGGFRVSEKQMELKTSAAASSTAPARGFILKCGCWMLF